MHRVNLSYSLLSDFVYKSHCYPVYKSHCYPVYKSHCYPGLGLGCRAAYLRYCYRFLRPFSCSSSSAACVSACSSYST